MAVVIVNHERALDTMACIASLLRQEAVRVEITVVDNGSQDNSAQQILKHYPTLTVLPLPRNLGFAGGFNAGIKQVLASDAPHVFLLNNDTLVEPGTIRALLSALRVWDVTVPKIRFHDTPDRIWAAGCRWRRFPPSVTMIGYQQLDGPVYNSPGALDYATGCALMVKRKVFEAIGGFDPAFENYMEDYDFCYRLRAASFTIGYVPEASILHRVSQTFGEDSPPKWRFLGRNTVLFYRKNDRFPSRFLWSYLAWVFVREVVKGQAALLPHFWRGIQEGFEILNRPAPGPVGMARKS